MNSGTKILNSQLIFVYRRNIDIRRQIFELENLLGSDFQLPFKLINIPDEINPDFPRIETFSIGDHSRLQISQTRIDLGTRFDDKFNENFEMVFNYMRDKWRILYAVARDANIQYSACVLSFIYYMDKLKINNFLKEHTGAYVISDSLRDFSIRFSIEFKNSYYLNIQASKITEEKIYLAGKSKEPFETLYGIEFIVDLNTKLEFENSNKFNEVCNDQLLNNIEEFINNHEITDLINGNILNV